jgi:YesN/AraC family two-component response regulator
MHGNDGAVAARPIHVLVVDDEPDVPTMFRQRLRRDLRSGSVVLQFANSGRAALDVMEMVGLDVVLIFTDVQMPEMNVLELLQQVRDKWPHVRVYIVTAYDGLNYTERATELGAHGYLTKPLDFSALRQIMLTT